MNTTEADWVVDEALAGQRLDAALAQLMPEHSRVRCRAWVETGQVRVNGNVVAPKMKVALGDAICVRASHPVACEHHQAEDLPLNIVHEDDHLLVVNKAADQVVHPAAGNLTGTLVNALLHHCATLAQLPRAGLIHRLDKGTTGLLVVAKTLEAHTALVRALQERCITRIYQAYVMGTLLQGKTIDAPIGRHPRQRILMAVVSDGKPAVSHVTVLRRFGHATHVRVQLETGRTHQIRVHMSHIKHPLIGDAAYRGRLQLPRGASERLKDCLSTFARPALHAHTLAFTHPITQEACFFEAPVPDDLMRLGAVLAEDDPA